jgi:hypothetical protein
MPRGLLSPEATVLASPTLAKAIIGASDIPRTSRGRMALHTGSKGPGRLISGLVCVVTVGSSDILLVCGRAGAGAFAPRDLDSLAPRASPGPWMRADRFLTCF